MNKVFVVFLILFMTVSTSFFFGQTNTTETPMTKEKIKEDFIQLGNDLLTGASEAGNNISEWIKEQTNKLQGSTTNLSCPQSKVGIVMDVNKNNNTITVVTTEGKSMTFGTNENTVILIQDATTGLQTPFVNGKEAKFKNIKKGDWIQFSYNLADLVKTILPDSSVETITAINIDVLR